MPISERSGRLSMGWGFTAPACENKLGESQASSSACKHEVRQAGFHAGEAVGEPEALLKILQAEVISTVNEDFDCAQAQPEISDRSRVAGADGVSQRQVAVGLETVSATNMAFQKWNARAAIERWAARAVCESDLPVTATKSQYSAWRKSKRVWRLSVRRSPPETGGWR